MQGSQDAHCRGRKLKPAIFGVGSYGKPVANQYNRCHWNRRCFTQTPTVDILAIPCREHENLLLDCGADDVRGRISDRDIFCVRQVSFGPKVSTELCKNKTCKSRPDTQRKTLDYQHCFSATHSINCKKRFRHFQKKLGQRFVVKQGLPEAIVTKVWVYGSGSGV